MGTALYKRVSDDKQEEGVSLESQNEKLEAFCKYKGFDDTKDYVDVASARTMEKRQDFQRMVKDIESGYIKRIVILKLDRLTRSLRDLMNFLHFLDKHGCELHSTIESIDTSTPSGRLLIQVLGIVAEWESTNISTRVSLNMQYQAEKGIWQSSAPYGFDLVDGKLFINEGESTLFRKACELIMNEGYSFLGSYKHMRNHYNVDWSPDFLTKKIEHETTVGNIKRNGIIIYNTHAPLLTTEERDKLLEIKKSNLTGRSKASHNDIFRRRIKCYQCNSTLTLNARKRKDGTYYYSYQCTDCFRRNKGSVIVVETVMEKSLIKYMNKLTLTGFHSLKQEPNDDEKKYNELQKGLVAIKNKRDKIQRAWISDLMTDADIEKYKREFDAEEQRIKEELSKISVVTRKVSVEELKGIKLMFKDGFESLTRNEKASFIQMHLKEIHFKRTKIKGYENRYKVDLTNVIFL